MSPRPLFLMYIGYAIHMCLVRTVLSLTTTHVPLRFVHLGERWHTNGVNVGEKGKTHVAQSTLAEESTNVLRKKRHSTHYGYLQKSLAEWTDDDHQASDHDDTTL